MDGVLNLNKPSGPTSHDIVAQVRRIVGKRKVGHAGTLDPSASGVLLVCLGEATRIVEYLMDWRKVYRATAIFGIVTDTEDAAGKVIAETEAIHIDKAMVEDVVRRFVGRITQMPPMASAVRYHGRRLYEFARKGRVVERSPRTVEVYSIRLLDFQPGVHPRAIFEVECSKGTYIRTLCADIGRELGCGGHLSALVRTAVGRFRIEDSVTPEELERFVAEGRLVEVLHTVDSVLSDLPAVELSREDSVRIAHGNPVILDPECASRLNEGSPVRIKTPGGCLVAVGFLHRAENGVVHIHPRKVFRLSALPAQSECPHASHIQ